METAYIYNVGRNVHVEIGDIHMEYVGPYSLVRFIKINKFDSGVIHVDTEFKIENQSWTDEDYIDLGYLFIENDYDAETMISNIKEIKIKQSAK